MYEYLTQGPEFDDGYGEVTDYHEPGNKIYVLVKTTPILDLLLLHLQTANEYKQTSLLQITSSNARFP